MKKKVISKKTKKTKKLPMPKPVKGYGYCGVWTPENTIGWMCSRFVSGELDRKYPSSPESNEYTKGERFFLCEIKIKPTKDKKGRPITKIMQ